MSTTSLWVPLVVVGIGVAGTLTVGISGGLITQRWPDKRDDRAWARRRNFHRRFDESRTDEQVAHLLAEMSVTQANFFEVTTKLREFVTTNFPLSNTT